MGRDVKGDVDDKARARVTDPLDAEHGESDLLAGQREAQVGAATGEFPAEAVRARGERKSLSTGTGAVLAGAGTLLSRIVGVLRQRIFGYFLGTSDAMDAFNAAFRI